LAFLVKQEKKRMINHNSAQTVMSMCFIVSTLVMFLVDEARASFSCGPHLLAYKVKALDGRNGAGVRCVRLRADPTVSLYWYGEGYWGQNTYRHIGGMYRAVTSGNNGFAFDIFGNGEDYRNQAQNLNVSLSPATGKPQTIRVTGAWNEEWALVPGNTVEEYTSSLSSVEKCGNHFQTYHIGGASGIRCIQREYSIWYGEGTWSGRTYGHIGVDSHNGGEATDICEPSRFDFCNHASPLNITPHLSIGPPYKYVPIKVTGAWNETWEPK
jgi:hypothetical protein